MILICSDGHESCFGKNECLEILCVIEILVLGRAVGDMKSGLISVHGVQDDLEKVQKITVPVNKMDPKYFIRLK